MKQIEEYVDELCYMENRLFEICKELKICFYSTNELVKAWCSLYRITKEYEYPDR